MSNITDPETTVTTTSTATTTLPTTAEVTSIETTQTNPATTAAPDKPLGAIIGGAVAGAVVLIVLIVIIVCCCRKKTNGPRPRQMRKASSEFFGRMRATFTRKVSSDQGLPSAEDIKHPSGKRPSPDAVKEEEPAVTMDIPEENSNLQQLKIHGIPPREVPPVPAVTPTLKPKSAMNSNHDAPPAACNIPNAKPGYVDMDGKGKAKKEDNLAPPPGNHGKPSNSPHGYVNASPSVDGQSGGGTPRGTPRGTPKPSPQPKPKKPNLKQAVSAPPADERSSDKPGYENYFGDASKRAGYQNVKTVVQNQKADTDQEIYQNSAFSEDDGDPQEDYENAAVAREMRFQSAQDLRLPAMTSSQKSNDYLNWSSAHNLATH